MCLNYIRMIDYSKTREIEPETELKFLIRWVNKQYEVVRKKSPYYTS